MVQFDQILQSRSFKRCYCFTEWTSGGVLRHAEFVGLRDDKEAGEVGRD